MARTQRMPRLLSLTDYDALPEGTPIELIEGRSIVTPAAMPIHQLLVTLIADALFRFARARRLGIAYADVDVLLPVGSAPDRPTVLRPDVLFVTAARRGIVGRQRVVGVPDLVVEVLSPENRANDLPGGVKFATYERAGAPCYWVIDPDERWGAAYLLHDGRLVGGERAGASGELRCPALPGLALRLDEVFAEMD
ncbi:MAG: Uma2 family endonuclease [Chloroflexi bacterium]|nr:Uma2 family endonuclease [Chloroflexota bacterium]